MLFDTAEYDWRTEKCDFHLNAIARVAEKVIVSVSSGKTSTYLALNKDPDDKRPYFYQFAVVLSSDPNAVPKDKGLLRECQKRIPWFEASHEVDKSLKVVLQLEQELQQEIRWVASEQTLEELIYKKKVLPDKTKRFCTTNLKLEPQFWDAYLNIGEGLQLGNNVDYFVPNPMTIEVQVGIRWDERSRIYRALGLEKGSTSCDSFEYAYCCDLDGKFIRKHRWIKTDWRLRTFPLYSQRITNEYIYKYWQSRNWDYDFPEIGNCTFCFNKKKAELQRQALLSPERLPNWMQLEKATGHTFNKFGSLENIIFGDVLPENSQFCSTCTD